MQTPRTEFAQALKAVATERGLDAAVILDTIKQAIIAAYRRDARERGEETEEFEYDVELNSTNGEAKIFAWPLEKPEEKKDVTPPGFGRIAAQTAKQVIHQKIREAEKSAIMEEFSVRVGNLISGMILRFEGPDVRIDIGRTEAIMPVNERIPNERLNSNQRLTFLLKEITETPKGKMLILSRADPMFVQKLFVREVPELASNSVEVKVIAREAGVRTKIAVFSNQSGVDPVGSCVGQKGVRVQAVTNELGGERVDIIAWSEDSSELIKSALAPAENLSVTLNEKTKTATVLAPEDQLSVAIGKDGQNVRLAAKLSGWRIEVEPSSAKAAPFAEVATKAESEGQGEPESELEKAEKKEAVTEVSQGDQVKTKVKTKKKKVVEKKTEVSEIPKEE
mgnify:FL=1